MPKTLVTFLLDKSYSMLSRLPATIEAFNSYVYTLRRDFEEKGGDPVLFQLVQFDSIAIEAGERVPVARVPYLSNETYVPRAGTPLIDAAYETISGLEGVVAPGDKVIVCIQTDGEENESRNHTWEKLRELIAGKQSLGWQLNFMGAGIDAYRQGSMMGIDRGSTLSYSDNVAMTRAAFAATASNASDFRRGFACSTAYSASQKLSAGDRFDTPGTANLWSIQGLVEDKPTATAKVGQ